MTIKDLLKLAADPVLMQELEKIAESISNDINRTEHEQKHEERRRKEAARRIIEEMKGA